MVVFRKSVNFREERLERLRMMLLLKDCSSQNEHHTQDPGIVASNGGNTAMNVHW